MEKNDPVTIFLTTEPGLEEVVQEELEDKLRSTPTFLKEVTPSPFGHKGMVRAVFSSYHPDLPEHLFQLRSIHHVMKGLKVLRSSSGSDITMEEVLQGVRNLEVEEFEKDTNQKFRITCNRLGNHDFGSMDIQKEAGSIIQEFYGMPVDLENYHHDYRIDIYGDTCSIGLQWTRTSLSKQRGRPFVPRIALKMNVAYALLRALKAEKNDPGPLLDPFCGSGSILLEAAAIHPEMELFGSDLYPRNIKGAERNIKAYEIEERTHLSALDARKLSSVHEKGKFKYIVTNPPYGMRLGEELDFFGFYKDILRDFNKILAPNGKVMIMVMKKGLFDEVLEKMDLFHVLDVIHIRMGMIWTHAFLLKQKD